MQNVVNNKNTYHIDDIWQIKQTLVVLQQLHLKEK